MQFRMKVLQGTTILTDSEWYPDIASLWQPYDLTTEGLVPQIFLGNMSSLVIATALFLIVLVRRFSNHMRKQIKYFEIIKKFENQAKHLQLHTTAAEYDLLNDSINKVFETGDEETEHRIKKAAVVNDTEHTINGANDSDGSEVSIYVEDE